MDKNFCGVCGGRLGASARYCKHCGAPAGESSRVCPSCGAKAGRDGTFCQTCGAKLPKLQHAHHPGGKRTPKFLTSAWFFIPAGTVLAGIVLFSLVRAFYALQNGTLARGGMLFLLCITVVLSILAFYCGKAFARAAAGLNAAQYRAALRASKSNGIKAARGIARPALTALCAVIAVVFCTAFALRSAKEPDDAAEQPAEATAAITQSPAAEIQPESLVKINGLWGLYTDETLGLKYLMRFVRFDDEKAVIGSCTDPEELDSVVNGGAASEEVTIDIVYDYTVTQVSLTEARGMDAPYIAAAEITLTDRSGATEPFTASLSFYQVLDFRNCTADNASNYPDTMYSYRTTTFAFDAKAVVQIATIPFEDLPLYGVWVGIDGWDAFSSFEKHDTNDIPFVYFSGDVMQYGLCSCAGDVLNFISDFQAESDRCTLLAEYPFSVESITYAANENYNYPIIDSCRITLSIDDSVRQDILMEEGSVFEWDGVTFRFSEGVEWDAPFESW